LTPEQEEKLTKCIENFSSPDFKIGGIEDHPSLTEEEKFWLTKECLLRYLRASKWHLGTALARVESTMKWRREFGIYDEMTPEYVEPESLTGKEVIFGFDTSLRPALFMYPSRQNTDGQKRQLQYAIFMLERAIDLMPAGVECLNLLINYADKAKQPSIGTARLMLSYLQNYYPERLGLALVANVPFLVNAFFKIIFPFIDPITREKIKFNPHLIEDGIFVKDQATVDWGGEIDFQWDHTKYWPELISLCNDLRAKQKERWKALGGKVGLSEWDIKGGGSLKPQANNANTVAAEAIPIVDTSKQESSEAVPEMKVDEPEIAVQTPAVVEPTAAA
jgi:hypothetical protein